MKHLNSIVKFDRSTEAKWGELKNGGVDSLYNPCYSLARKYD